VPPRFDDPISTDVARRHVGKKPLNNPKYIIGTYLHYGPTFNSS
jgi:hypothetical protein